jgi:hypothetical protein
MTQAARPSGLVVALDYNHAGNRWQPDPPAAFHTFYHAFLSWRQANHWDNHMADHLPALFHSAGLVEVESHLQDEISERGDPDFAQRSALWPEVIEKLGESLVQAGVLTAAQLQAASECCEPWIGTDLQKQSLSLRAVVGRKELK